jgi:hypothetical protein
VTETETIVGGCVFYGFDLSSCGNKYALVFSTVIDCWIVACAVSDLVLSDLLVLVVPSCCSH